MLVGTYLTLHHTLPHVQGSFSGSGISQAPLLALGTDLGVLAPGVGGNWCEVLFGVLCSCVC